MNGMNRIIWPALGQKNGRLSPSVVGRSATVAGQGRGSVTPSASAAAAVLRSSSDALGVWTSDADSELPPVLQHLSRGEQLEMEVQSAAGCNEAVNDHFCFRCLKRRPYYSNSLVLIHSLTEKLPEGGQTVGQQRYT